MIFTYIPDKKGNIELGFIAKKSFFAEMYFRISDCQVEGCFRYVSSKDIKRQCKVKNGGKLMIS